MTDDYKEGDNTFTVKIKKVVIEIGPAQLGAANLKELRNAQLKIRAAE